MELFSNSEARAEVFAIYKTDQNQIEKDVEIIKNWLKKQPHLPQKLQTENFIEQVLVHSKFSVEKTKKKLELYFTGKNTFKDLYELLANKELTLPTQNWWVFLPLPQLGPSNERIFIVYCPGFNTEYEMWKSAQGVLATVELLAHFGFSNGMRFVMDMKNFSVDLLKYFDFAIYLRMIKLTLTCYSSRCLSVDIINSPSFFNIVMSGVKPVLTEKLASRIKFHNDLESLYTSLDPKYLPEEYGGKAGSCQDLIGKLDQLFDKHRSFLKDVINYKSDESLRVGGPKYENEGLEGTFKQLNVD